MTASLRISGRVQVSIDARHLECCTGFQHPFASTMHVLVPWAGSDFPGGGNVVIRRARPISHRLEGGTSRRGACPLHG